MNLKSVFGGRHRKSDFFLIFYRKRQCGTRGESEVLGGGGRSPMLSKLSKKKSEKAAKSKKKIRYFFFTENGLKCIRNPTKHL